MKLFWINSELKSFLRFYPTIRINIVDKCFQLEVSPGKSVG